MIWGIPMTCDVVIVGDPTYRFASASPPSSSLSSSSVRVQFSNPINVKISQYGSAFIKDFAALHVAGEAAPDLNFHQGGYLFLAGGAPVDDPAVDFDDFEPRWAEFEDQVWPALAARSPQFQAINFIYANDFAGHGLQQAPTAGRAVSELITHGGFRSLDLSEVGYEPFLAGRPFVEKAVI